MGDKNTDWAEFGNNLRRLRVKRGLTLRELAKATGCCSYKHLSNIEKGNTRPSLNVYVALVRGLGVFRIIPLMDTAPRGNKCDGKLTRRTRGET
jgi:transcriptional regulator with XRE-family HTH domain